MIAAITTAAAESSTVIGWDDHAQRDLLVFGAIALLGAVAFLAQRMRAPYPIILVLAGLGIGFAPMVPDVQLDPDLIFVVFLPALIYAQAYFTSVHDLKRSARTIGLLAIGLVIATTLVVGVVAHSVVDGMSWAVAFTLGAIVSPTDPIAATSILGRLNVSRRLVNTIEGESLVNDGSGLVLYKVAVAAVVTGSFSASEAGAAFVWSVVGGIAIGIGIGAVLTKLRRANTHGPTDVLLSLASGYLAYLPAEALGVSGVLAAVTTGLWLGFRTPSIVRDPETRLQIRAIWENVSYVANTVLFLLVGLQLHSILNRLDGISAETLIGYAVAVSAAVIFTRIVWVFPFMYLPRKLLGTIRDADDLSQHWHLPTLLAWVGMRGAVTLAAALALPLHVEGGGPFPFRDLVIFLAFSVILATLVLQGLTLPALVRVLDVDDGGEEARAEARARARSAEAAIARIDELATEEWVRDDTAERMRSLYDFRTRRFTAIAEQQDSTPDIEQRSRDYQRFLRELHQAERVFARELRDSNEITTEVLHRIERDLDLEDTRLN